MSAIQIVGRRSSLFTRAALIFAEELSLRHELLPIYDMTTLEPEADAGNPALKLLILRRGGAALFGTLNICRALAEEAGNPADIVWPEQLHDDVSRNAQELVWHCMAAQVQIIIGTVVGKLPADDVLFVKARAGLERSLCWLEQNLEVALSALPSQRRLSVFEVTLFCLLEHLAWRRTMPTGGYAALAEFVRLFAVRPAARGTAYAFDIPPSESNGATITEQS